MAGGGLRGRRVCRGGWAAEEEPSLPPPLPPPSRPSEFPGLPQLSSSLGALAYSATRLQPAACERPPGTGPGVAGWADIPAVGPSGLLGPNAWASRSEWVAVVGTVPASPGGERGRGPWASCREHL